MYKNKPHINMKLAIIYLVLTLGFLFIYWLIAHYFKIENFIDSSAIVGLLGCSTTLFGTIVLLHTFNSWREQKSIEVIAIESKLIINELNRANKASENLFASFMQNNHDLYELNKITLYNLVNNNIKFQLDTLYYLICVNNNEKLDEDLKEVIFQHNQSYALFNSKLNNVSDNKDKLSFDDINKQIITAFSDYRNCNLKLKFYLSNYALYKDR